MRPPPMHLLRPALPDPGWGDDIRGLRRDPLAAMTGSLTGGPKRPLQRPLSPHTVRLQRGAAGRAHCS